MKSGKSVPGLCKTSRLKSAESQEEEGEVMFGKEVAVKACNDGSRPAPSPFHARRPA